jgi:hypothetical protein
VIDSISPSSCQHHLNSGLDVLIEAVGIAVAVALHARLRE